jgi:hypothetical protein
MRGFLPTLAAHTSSMTGSWPNMYLFRLHDHLPRHAYIHIYTHTKQHKSRHGMVSTARSRALYARYIVNTRAHIHTHWNTHDNTQGRTSTDRLRNVPTASSCILSSCDLSSEIKGGRQPFSTMRTCTRAHTHILVNTHVHKTALFHHMRAVGTSIPVSCT